MNERLTEMYRSCRPKEALASQDQFKSANVLIGSEIDKLLSYLYVSVQTSQIIKKNYINILELKND